MRKFFTFIALFSIAGIMALRAQSTSSNLETQPITDRTLLFSVSDTGTYLPITWGLDLAWLSETNIRRGINYMGADIIDVVRSSFTPTDSLVNGQLQTDEQNTLNERLNIINTWLGPMDIILNCDHPSVHEWYIGNAAHWAELIDVTTRLHQAAGHTVNSVSPFNEPDYGWGQYTGDGMADFYDIAGELRNKQLFNDIRICGGNTLNCDQALSWYNYLKSRLDEGNTHQLAGSFDSYATFFQTVRANGDHATADELHNTMEAMVGVEYGMQTGIWWGTAELSRGEFCKASGGRRLAYAEHRDNWTAAAVYRSPSEKYQAFVGSSERQAATTTYRFVSTERDVYFDGHGPQREYVVEVPGGTGYQDGQSNAECVVNITWGDDVQPVVDGDYMIVNRKSGYILEVANASTTDGATLRQYTNSGASHQQWNVTPVDTRIGDDFSYFQITNANSGNSPDVLNWSLDEGTNIIAWTFTNINQQWFLEYAEDGYFYIRNRHSAMCLAPINYSTGNGAKIVQYEKDGDESQQWRFVPVGVTLDDVAPAAPTNLVATANEASVKLNWDANAETDVTGYTIFRKAADDENYQTIGRNINSTSFVDNTATQGGPYTYAIKAIDKSVNSSEYSTAVSASPTTENGLVAVYDFEDDLLDGSVNANDAAANESVTYTSGKTGDKAASFDGEDAYVQLPADIANVDEITFATWIYWNGGSIRQQIFNFSNGEDDYIYLNPRTRFGIVKDGEEEYLGGDRLTIDAWSHVAITLSDTAACLYINGELADKSNEFTVNTMDIKPVLNYIGRGESLSNSDVYVNAVIDDFRIYNYELSATEVLALASVGSAVHSNIENAIAVYPVPASETLNVQLDGTFTGSNATVGMYDMNGRLVLEKLVTNVSEMQLNVSEVPQGIYILKVNDSAISVTKRIIIQH